MKNSISRLILGTFFTLCFSCKAQQIVNYSSYNDGENAGKYFKDIDHHFDPFLGVWEYQNGDQTFRVILWKEQSIEHENGSQPSFYEDAIKGHYEMVHIGGGQPGDPFEQTIYTSQKKIGQTSSDWFPVISGGSNNSINFSGYIYDNSMPLNLEYPLGIRGNLELTIIPNSVPLQMQWKVTLPEGIRDPDQPTEFNIPTDIILTKQ